MSKALGTNAAMPAPSGVSYRGRWGLVRYGPFAPRSCHGGHGTVAANFLILLAVAAVVSATRDIATLLQEGLGSSLGYWAANLAESTRCVVSGMEPMALSLS
jgi:hypothetical protein